MKVITHRYRESNKYKTSYLINLVDHNGRPLESHVARNSREKVDLSEDLAIKHKVQIIQHNSGYSILER
jgi:hypothetical protein